MKISVMTGNIIDKLTNNDNKLSLKISCASKFIDRYLASLQDNSLLNKPMINLQLRLCEIFFTYLYPLKEQNKGITGSKHEVEPKGWLLNMALKRVLISNIDEIIRYIKRIKGTWRRWIRKSKYEWHKCCISLQSIYLCVRCAGGFIWIESLDWASFTEIKESVNLRSGRC